MPKVTTVGLEARARLIKAHGGKGYEQRAPYREAIAALSGDQVLEFEPEDGETLRQIRVRLARAAKELGTEIKSGETREGTLLVWLASPSPARRQRRRVSGEEASAAGAALG